jgi:hypothetical protein
LNELLMSKPALFKGNYASTCIQHPYKSNRIWAPALSCCFCEEVPLPSALAPISYVPISWQSKWPHFEMATCWTLSKHPQGSHILHTCQPSYSPQRNPTLNHFEQTVHEQACHLHEFLSSTSVNHLNNSALVWTHPCCTCWEKLHHILKYPSLMCL